MKFILAGVLALACLVPGAQGQQATHRLGVGANYWVALSDIKVDDIDDKGFGYVATYQFRPGLFGLQLDVEWLPDRFGEDALAPAAYVIVGRGVYLAAGVGLIRQDGSWADDPFVALKAGLNMKVLPSMFLDVGVSYRFDSKQKIDDALDDIDTDTLFLGAALRLAF